MSKVHNIVPDIFIPGFAKCGTSTLFKYLVAHPKIQGGMGKESHIYSIDKKFNERFDKSSKNSLISYFSEVPSSKLKIDASTSYMISPHAAERIKNDNPDAKIIIISRDPIERVLSHYNWLCSIGIDCKTFVEEINEWDNVRYNPDNNIKGNYKNYIEYSMYGEQLERYLKVFNRNQIFYTTLEELSRDSNSVLNKLFEYLEIEGVKPSKKRWANKTQKKASIYKYPKYIDKLKKIVPKSFAQLLKKTLKPLFKKNVKKHVLSENEKMMLYKRLQRDIVKARNLGYYSTEWKVVNELIQKDHE